MLFDANETWPNPATRYDVCVCGTGPAGLTAARKIASYEKNVLLLEAGGLTYTDLSQEVYEGSNVGLQYWGLTGCRQRYFGGTSNHWAGRCGIFDPIDFEQRQFYALPGWPIAREDVLAHLNEAGDILDLGDQDLDSPYNAILAGSRFKLTGVAHSPPTRFAPKYLDEVKKSGTIDAFVNANIVDLRLGNDGKRVEQIVLRNYKDDEARLNANRYVLALGAIENARFLLTADRQMPGGLGNGSDLVGRCFMEHLNVPIGRFLVSNPGFWSKGGIGLVPREDFIRDNEIGNGIIALAPDSKPRSYGRLRYFKQSLRLALCNSQSITEAARHLIDYDCPGDGVITSLIEQTPDPDSRVTLTNERDKFGLRRVQLNWRLNNGDHHTIRTLAVAAAKELARLDLARVQLKAFILDEDSELEVYGHCHHMGTTRMSASPQHGVVDTNSKVHGIDNLYVAGSSIFPTSGGTNPTLTIVMLSLRLGTHLGGLK